MSFSAVMNTCIVCLKHEWLLLFSFRFGFLVKLFLGVQDWSHIGLVVTLEFFNNLVLEAFADFEFAFEDVRDDLSHCYSVTFVFVAFERSTKLLFSQVLVDGSQSSDLSLKGVVVELKFVGVRLECAYGRVLVVEFAALSLDQCCHGVDVVECVSSAFLL